MDSSGINRCWCPQWLAEMFPAGLLQALVFITFLVQCQVSVSRYNLFATNLFRTSVKGAKDGNVLTTCAQLQAALTTFVVQFILVWLDLLLICSALKFRIERRYCVWLGYWPFTCYVLHILQNYLCFGDRLSVSTLCESVHLICVQNHGHMWCSEQICTLKTYLSVAAEAPIKSNLWSTIFISFLWCNGASSLASEIITIALDKYSLC